MTPESLFTILREHFPFKYEGLNFSSDYQALCALLLAGHTNDVMVNRILPDLLRRYPHADALADASAAELEQLIYSIGYYREKAARLRRAARYFSRELGSVLPTDIKELQKIPGIGPKSAALVLHQLHGQSHLIVDTHCARAAWRLGLVPGKRHTLDAARKALKLYFPAESWRDQWAGISTALNRLGAILCTARVPRCLECPLGEICPSFSGLS